MKYILQLSINELCDINLGILDIPKEEKQNVEEAYNCELEYNNLEIAFF